MGIGSECDTEESDRGDRGSQLAVSVRRVEELAAEDSFSDRELFDARAHERSRSDRELFDARAHERSRSDRELFDARARHLGGSSCSEMLCFPKRGLVWKPSSRFSPLSLCSKGYPSPSCNPASLSSAGV